MLRIRDPLLFWFLDPGYVFSRSQILDLESRISDPKPYFWELRSNYLDKKYFSSLLIGWHFFLHLFKNKIIFNFVKFTATKKARKQKKSPLLYLVVGYGMGKNQDLGSGKNIPDPQHCLDLFWTKTFLTIRCWTFQFWFSQLKEILRIRFLLQGRLTAYSRPTSLLFWTLSMLTVYRIKNRKWEFRTVEHACAVQNIKPAWKNRLSAMCLWHVGCVRLR